ncbi:hypothetical protein Bhyg_04348 [Pseudolycoriella hygida]|uniref:Uncharacterized protein n=1 Tax=Pseudolycoriella hygida TaxID=35572 RepID=A0A9Q0NGK9_9DIPT|nr:hypothetical protein Bhyg_04348 [Pseudolycoriella hygida]
MKPRPDTSYSAGPGPTVSSRDICVCRFPKLKAAAVGLDDSAIFLFKMYIDYNKVVYDSREGFPAMSMGKLPINEFQTFTNNEINNSIHNYLEVAVGPLMPGRMTSICHDYVGTQIRIKN